MNVRALLHYGADGCFFALTNVGKDIVANILSYLGPPGAKNLLCYGERDNLVCASCVRFGMAPSTQPFITKEQYAVICHRLPCTYTFGLP